VLGALEAQVAADVDCAVGTAVFQVSGTWKGKIVIEGAVDGVYNNLSIVQPGGAIVFTGVNNDNQNGVYRVLLIAGYTKLRLRMSTYTSGTASVVVNTAPLVPAAYAWQLNAANLQMTATQGTNPWVCSLPDTTVIDADVKAIGTGSWYPLYLDDIALDELASLRVDKAGNLITRGTVLTDEGSLYEPFAGVTLSTDWTKSEGTGTNVAVANSVCTLTAGTTSGSKVSIDRQLDFTPLVCTYVLTVSQRVANQNLFIGYGDTALPEDADTMFARIHFYGTDASLISCETQSSTDTGGSEGVNTQIILPQGLLTSQKLIYQINNDGKKVRFYVGLTLDSLSLVATNSVQIPDPYTVMYNGARIHNSGVPTSSTTFNIDTIEISNINIVDISGEIRGKVSVEQNVVASVVNSSTTNLNAGATFTGSEEKTLGVAGIQVSLKTDQNCTIYVDQSPDGTNWDLHDTYKYYASLNNFGITVQAVNSYYRVRVTNDGIISTTYFRLQSALCPIVESLPRSLDSNGHLKVGIKSIEDEYGYEVENTSHGEMRVVEPVRLVGAVFEGTTIDSQFWAAAASGTSAAVAQAETEATLTSGTSANATATLFTARRARYSSGASMRYRSITQMLDNGGTLHNKRRWGIGWGSTAMPAVTDGAYFQMDGTTFGIRVRKM